MAVLQLLHQRKERRLRTRLMNSRVMASHRAVRVARSGTVIDVVAVHLGCGSAPQKIWAVPKLPSAVRPCYQFHVFRRRRILALHCSLESRTTARQNAGSAERAASADSVVIMHLGPNGTLPLGRGRAVVWMLVAAILRLPCAIGAL